MAVTKTKISYLRDRLKVVARKHKRDIHENIKILSEPTAEEKVAQILNGDAKIKKDDMMNAIGNKSLGCPTWLYHAFKAFHFDGEDDIMAKNAAITKLRKSLTDKVDDDLDGMIDSFVLAGQDDEDIVRFFQEKDYCQLSDDEKKLWEGGDTIQCRLCGCMAKREFCGECETEIRKYIHPEE